MSTGASTQTPSLPGKARAAARSLPESGFAAAVRGRIAWCTSITVWRLACCIGGNSCIHSR